MRWRASPDYMYSVRPQSVSRCGRGGRRTVGEGARKTERQDGRETKANGQTNPEPLLDGLQEQCRRDVQYRTG